jgi:hypothetical protein
MWCTSWALAATLDVPSVYPTLSAANEAAVDGDVIRLAPGAYTETVIVHHALVVEGEPGVVLHPADDSGALIVTAEGVIVRALTIDGQGLSAGIRLETGSLQLEEVTFVNTTRGTDGGAVQAGLGATSLTVLRSSFDGSSSSSGSGGALALLAGSLVVEDSTFTGGSASTGGHVYAAPGTLSTEIRRSTFSGGWAESTGGAGYLKSGIVTVEQSVFSGNSAYDGGALGSYAGSLTIEECWFEGNVALNDGGALDSNATQAVVRRSVFCDNEATSGGGAVEVQSGSTELRASVFVANRADVGGAVVNAAGELLVSHGGFAGNEANRGSAVQAWAAGAADDSVFLEHTLSAALSSGDELDPLSASHDAFWNNTSGDLADGVTDLGGHVLGDPLLGAVACDPLMFAPAAGSPLLGAASDGTDIGPLSGPDTWPDIDDDGSISLLDCDDTSDSVYPGAPELAADGVDQNCDGTELCYDDSDGDGLGTDTLVPSQDLTCEGLGVASIPGDLCPEADDTLDADGDSWPDGCDACPLHAAEDNVDADSDGICDSGDLCPGADDALDADSDGVPDGCDEDAPAPPVDVDADGDGLTDEQEAALGTDPELPDTDGDGVYDGRDSSPLDAGGVGGPKAPEVDAGCGCSSAAQGAPALPAFALLLSLIVAQRRRGG